VLALVLVRVLVTVPVLGVVTVVAFVPVILLLLVSRMRSVARSAPFLAEGCHPESRRARMAAGPALATVRVAGCDQLDRGRVLVARSKILAFGLRRVGPA